MKEALGFKCDSFDKVLLCYGLEFVTCQQFLTYFDGGFAFCIFCTYGKDRWCSFSVG